MATPSPSARRTIALAGATGDLGERMLKALVARGAEVRALVRPNTAPEKLARIESLGGAPAPADPGDVSAMARAIGGASCVVSALNGLRDVIVDRQSTLLHATEQARVPRFIPSDYSEDFTNTEPGKNRNLDLRRDFMRVVDQADVRATSILNGAFMDMLGAEMPIIQPKIHRVVYWIDADQPLDFTTKDDVAAYTAAAALDDATPRWLRIAGDTATTRELAQVMSEVTGDAYKPQWAGNLNMLGVMISVAKVVAPQPGNPFPPYQGMQYMRDMYSGAGKLHDLDNDRYPEISWTSLREDLAARGVGVEGSAVSA